MKMVTMKDIAQILGTSVVSVSKALAGKSGVSEELRDKIIRKAQELGYNYNGIPEVKAEVSENIGILVADRFFTDNSFYYNVYREVLLECGNIGVSCLLEIVMPNNEDNLIMPNLLSGQKCGGIIFLGEMSSSYIMAVAEAGIPYILLDFYHDTSNDDSVISDGLSGSYQLTKYLIDSGYTQIGFVGSYLATSSILDRYLGYSKALLIKRLPLRQEWILPDRGEDGIFIEIELPENMPQAFVCNCDETAYLLIVKLKGLGYRIPEDIAIVGFDDYRFAVLSDPPLTTYRVNIASMGKAAVGRLFRKMAGSPYTKGCSIISGEMIIRNSTKNIRKNT